MSAFRPSQIAGLVFVMVAAVIVFLEFRAWSQRNNTVRAVDQAVIEAKADRIDKAQLDVLVSGCPEREASQPSSEQVEVFAWKGVFRTYKMRVSYSEDDLVMRRPVDE